MAGGATAGEDGGKSWMPVVVPAAFVAVLVGLVVVMASINEPPPKDKAGTAGKSNLGEPSTGTGSSVPARPRRSPIPTDLSKLSDGTAPGADDPNLKDLGEGLKYRDLKEGDGEAIAADATPIMDYIGWLPANGFVFDSSFRGGKPPLDLPLRRLIEGWKRGVPGMKVGGVRKLVIPGHLAYPDGQGDIPPGATLVFEIELLGIK